MTVISKRVFRPVSGKVGLAQERVKQLATILTRAGGRTRVANVAWGDGAREIHLYGVFENMQAGGKAFSAMISDPDFAALRTETENDPASHWEGPEVWRCVFGEPQPSYTVMLQREYQMDRRNLKSAIALLPEIQALRPNMPMIAVVPVISGDMGRFMVGYFANSLVDLGETIDSVGFSDAFQSIVLRAAELGSLTKARVLVNI